MAASTAVDSGKNEHLASFSSYQVRVPIGQGFTPSSLLGEVGRLWERYSRTLPFSKRLKLSSKMEPGELSAFVSFKLRSGRKETIYDFSVELNIEDRCALVKFHDMSSELPASIRARFLRSMNQVYLRLHAKYELGNAMKRSEQYY